MVYSKTHWIPHVTFRSLTLMAAYVVDGCQSMLDYGETPSVEPLAHTWMFELLLKVHFAINEMPLLCLSLPLSFSYISFCIAHLACSGPLLRTDFVFNSVCTSVARIQAHERCTSWRQKNKVERAHKIEGLKDWERQEEEVGACRRSMHSYWIHKGWKGPWQES